MSIFLKPTDFKIKNPITGTYMGQSIFTENDTQTQLTRINAAGTSQVNAINTKGQETLASIPADYTELSDSVDNLKSDVTDLTDIYQSKSFSSEGGWSIVYFPMRAGKTYLITPSISGGTVYTYDGTSNVQQILSSGTAGKTVEFTPISDTEYIRFWYSGAVTLDVSLKDSFISEIKADISGINTELAIKHVCYFVSADMFENGAWVNGVKSSYRLANRARTNSKYYFVNDTNISKVGTTGTFYIEYYDHTGNVINTVNWTNAAIIPAGSIISLTLTPSNSGTATETSVEDILSLFSFENANHSIINDFADKNQVVTGIISSTGIHSSFYPNRLSVLDYLKINEGLLQIECDTGYKFFLVTYDKNFNVITYGPSWETGLHFKDVSGAEYIRISLSKSDDSDIALSEISHLAVSKYVTSAWNTNSLLSISKDGINDSNKDYAPKFPKSSLISIKKAYQQGFRDIELHVQVTADNIPVIYHDVSINRYARNTDGSAISETVNVSESTLATLNTYDFGILFGEQYAGTKITTLEEALILCKYLGLKIWLEPSVSLGEAKETLVLNLIKQYGLDTQIAFFSYYASTLARVHAKMPKADLYFYPSGSASDVDTNINANIDALSSLIDNNDVYVYVFADTELSESTKTALKNAGIKRLVQCLDGTEPENIITALENNLDCNGIVSQVVPAYLVALRNI